MFAELRRHYSVVEQEVHDELAALINRTPVLRQCMEECMAVLMVGG